MLHPSSTRRHIVPCWARTGKKTFSIITRDKILQIMDYLSLRSTRLRRRANTHRAYPLISLSFLTYEYALNALIFPRSLALSVSVYIYRLTQDALTGCIAQSAKADAATLTIRLTAGLFVSRRRYLLMHHPTAFYFIFLHPDRPSYSLGVTNTWKTVVKKNSLDLFSRKNCALWYPRNIFFLFELNMLVNLNK